MTRPENNIKRRAAIVKSFVAPEAAGTAQDAPAGSGGVIARNLNGAHRRRSRWLARWG